MRSGLLILSLVVLTGCAAQPPARLASGTQQCLSAAAISGRYAVPPNSIMFDMIGRTNFRNDLATACPSLQRLGQSAAIVFDSSSGGQICSGDRVRLFDSRDMGPNRLAGAQICVLGPFIPVPG